MSETMKPLIYAASEGPLSRAQAEAAFEELFEERMALYERWADVRVDTAGLSQEEVCDRVVRALG